MISKRNIVPSLNQCQLPAASRRQSVAPGSESRPPSHQGSAVQNRSSAIPDVTNRPEVAPSIVAGDDTELLRLSTKLEVAAREELRLAGLAEAIPEGRHDYLPAHRKRGDQLKVALGLYKAIDATQAVTLDGLRAKARASDWHHRHPLCGLGKYGSYEQPSIIADLLRMPA